MKMTLTLLATLTILTSAAQQRPKHFSLDFLSHDSILSILPGFVFHSDSMEAGVKAFVYKSDKGGKLQFFYQQTSSGFKLKSIVADEATTAVIYRDWFGRQVETTQVIKGDRWRFEGGSMDVSKFTESTYRIRLFGPPTPINQ